jgi:hypothetical protein
VNRIATDIHPGALALWRAWHGQQTLEMNEMLNILVATK